MNANGQHHLDDDVLIIDDSTDSADASNNWKVVIVDDEPDIHATTKLLLKNFEYNNRRLNMVSLFSGEDAKRYMTNNHDVALMLLDVVMENDQAGLHVVNYIRNEIGNKHTRIVIRTGQPGMAPEEEVIKKYDIEDYKHKTELSVQKLQTTVTTALRTYDELNRIETLVRERTRELNERNESILQSIKAAQRIQTAILPSIDYIGKRLDQVFVYYQPKDIVSGDIYWFWQDDTRSIIANIDAAGHGVPGAIMSIFAYNLLNQIVYQYDLRDPAHILSLLDEKLMRMLNEQSGGQAVNESLDANVLLIDHSTNRLDFAGANRPLFYFENGEKNEITEFPGDKFPIGDKQYIDKKFTKHSVQLKKGDRVFVFTDGLVDQFGGDDQKRFSIKRFKELLIQTNRLPLGEQHAAILAEFRTWKGQSDQTDDVCFISMQPV